MKITVYYEDKNHPLILDVPDNDCEIWIENDYRQRLSRAQDKASVTRRTAQEIMDEECNKPTFNSHQRETRRHVSLDALDLDGNLLIANDRFDGMKIVEGKVTLADKPGIGVTPIKKG